MAEGTLSLRKKPDSAPSSERGRRDHHGGEADEAVEGGDQLGHRGHGDAPGDDEADAAADQDRADDFR